MPRGIPQTPAIRPQAYYAHCPRCGGLNEDVNEGIVSCTHCGRKFEVTAPEVA